MKTIWVVDPDVWLFMDEDEVIHLIGRIGINDNVLGREVGS